MTGARRWRASNDRDSIVEVGEVGRRAIEAVTGNDLFDRAARDLRVFMAVLSYTALRSRVWDYASVSQIAETAGIAERDEDGRVPGWARDRVTDSLRRLSEAAVIGYEPGAGRLALARLTLAPETRADVCSCSASETPADVCSCSIAKHPPSQRGNTPLLSAETPAHVCGTPSSTPSVLPSETRKKNEDDEVSGSETDPSAGAPGPAPTGTWSAGKVEDARVLAAIDNVVVPFATGRKTTVARIDVKLVAAVRAFLASGRDDAMLAGCLDGVGRIRSNATGLVAAHVGRAAAEPISDIEQSIIADGVERGRLAVKVDRLRGEHEGVDPYLVTVDESIGRADTPAVIRAAIDAAVAAYESHGPASFDALRRRLDAVRQDDGRDVRFGPELRALIGYADEYPTGSKYAAKCVEYAASLAAVEADTIPAEPVVDVRAEADALVEQLRAMQVDNPDRLAAIKSSAKSGGARNLRASDVAESDLNIVRRAIEDHAA